MLRASWPVILRRFDRHGTTGDLYCIFTVKDSPQPSVETGMASKVIVTLEDDLDGGPAQETVRFGVGGAEYEIDLSKKNARAFRKQLAPYLEHARRAGRGRRRPSGAAPGRERAGDIRAWASQQGITVSGRGRIPASVVAQYDAAANGR
jgi:hypothetical protein